MQNLTDISREPGVLLMGVLEGSPAAYQVCDANGRCLFVNQTFVELFGREPPAGYNILRDDVMISRGMPPLIRRALAGETIHIPAQWHDLQINRAGRKRRAGIAVTLYPLRDTRGAIQQIALCFQDVTAELDLKQAELKLRESEIHLMSSQRIAHVGSWELDLTELDNLDVNPLRWTDECYRIFGFEPGEVEVTNDLFWQRVHPEDRPAIQAAVSGALEHGTTYSIEHRIILSRGGDERVIHERADIVREPETGRMLKLIGTSQDVTERKRVEEALLELNEQLEQRIRDLARSNMELQQFAYIASHDLQSPLRSISGFLHLLVENYRDRLDQQGEEWIGRVMANVQRMQHMIRDLLEYARVDARGQPYQTVEMTQVLEDVLETFESQIHECSVHVVYDDLPAVAGDRSLLVQLLQNLIGNAIKYRSDRRLEIQISAVRAGGKWRFAVKDNGIGFDPKHRERVFQIFRRLHTQQAYSGNGIGLAICQRVIHFHGGEIWVESQPDAGSTFYFTIPDRPAANRQIARNEPAGKTGSG